MVDPRRMLIALYAFLGVMALLIHFVLLSSPRYNWLSGMTEAEAAAAAVEASIEPTSRGV